MNFSLCYYITTNCTKSRYTHYPSILSSYWMDYVLVLTLVTSGDSRDAGGTSLSEGIAGDFLPRTRSLKHDDVLVK